MAISGTLSLPSFNFLLLLPVLYGVVAVHEAGHLVAGKLVGLGSEGIAIGGFLLVQTGPDWMIRFEGRRILSGGLAKPLTDGENISRTQILWMVAGGSLASTFLAGICSVAFYRYGTGPAGIMNCLLLCSVGVMLSTIVPYSVGLTKSDGAQLWQLLRHPTCASSWNALLALESAEAKGVVPRDWELGVIEHLMATDRREAAYPYHQMLLYYRRLDEDSGMEALTHLENALARSGGSAAALRHSCFLEAAFASAMWRKDAEQSRVWLSRARKVREPESPDAVEAAIAMCEGRYDTALQRFAKAREFLIMRKLDSGLARFGKEKWGEWEEECRRALCVVHESREQVKSG